MRQPGFTRGGRALLFERLSRGDEALSAGQERELRVTSGASLRQSVRRELEKLLNTRCPVPQRQLRGRERLVIHYGVADFTSLSPQSREVKRRLERELVRVIETFEPRLQEIRVHVGTETAEDPLRRPKLEHIPRGEGTLGHATPSPNSESRLAVRIDAMMVAGSIREPVSFPVYKKDSGDWEVLFPKAKGSKGENA